MRARGLAVAIAVLASLGGLAYFRTASSSKPQDGPPARTNAGRRGADGPVSVVAVAAGREDIKIVRRSIGYVEPVAVVAVKSRIQSQLLKQHFVEGQMVAQGDLLFTLDDREFAAQVAKDEATLARDQAAVARTTADLERARQLLARNAGTQQALDSATADNKTTSANVLGDAALLEADRLRLSYTKIYAPISGRIGAVTVTPGNLVNASDAGPGMVTITGVKPVRVTFTLPERDLSVVRAASASANPPVVKLIPHGGGDVIASGKLIFIDSAVDQASGTILLKGEFPNEDLKLWPGQYCDIELEVGSHSQAVTVPSVALQTSKDGDFLYVEKPDHSIEIRQVTTGFVDHGRAEILEGLGNGEKVITDGQLRLANGARVRDASASQAASVAN